MFMDERYAAGAWMRRSGECSWMNGKFKAVVFCTQDQSAIIEMRKPTSMGGLGRMDAQERRMFMDER